MQTFKSFTRGFLIYVVAVPVVVISCSVYMEFKININIPAGTG